MKTEIPVAEKLASHAQKFIASRTNDISTIETLLKEKDFEGISNISHNIKGISKSYGYPTLGLIAKSMEISGQQKNIDEIVLLVNQMKEYIKSYTNN